MGQGAPLPGVRGREQSGQVRPWPPPEYELSCPDGDFIGAKTDISRLFLHSGPLLLSVSAQPFSQVCIHVSKVQSFLLRLSWSLWSF